jgi:hypothetical protein
MLPITLPPIENNISIIINEEDYNNQSSIDLESFLKAFNFLEDADYSIQNSIEIDEVEDEQIFDPLSQYDELILSSIDENFLPSESNSIINDNNDVYNSSLKLTEFQKNFNDNIDISLNQINNNTNIKILNNNDETKFLKKIIKDNSINENDKNDKNSNILSNNLISFLNSSANDTKDKSSDISNNTSRCSVHKQLFIIDKSCINKSETKMLNKKRLRKTKNSKKRVETKEKSIYRNFRLFISTKKKEFREIIAKNKPFFDEFLNIKRKKNANNDIKVAEIKRDKRAYFLFKFGDKTFKSYNQDFMKFIYGKKDIRFLYRKYLEDKEFFAKNPIQKKIQDKEGKIKLVADHSPDLMEYREHLLDYVYPSKEEEIDRRNLDKNQSSVIKKDNMYGKMTNNNLVKSNINNRCDYS